MGDRANYPKTGKLQSASPTIFGVYLGVDMKKIVLTQGKVALVDDDMFEKLNQFKWCVQKGGNTYYAVRNSPTINGKRRRILMHYEIIGKPSKGMEMDYKDGSGLHNFKNNLRFVTKRQNGQNRKNQNKSSQYPGIYWHKASGKWIARIVINGNQKYLGLFTDEQKAYEAYKQAVNALGETVIGSSVKCLPGYLQL